MNNKDIRICIIGGGPAGTSAAMYLEKKGYENYVIYEKTDRVGGKAFSPMMKWALSWAAKRISPFMNVRNSAAPPTSTVLLWDVAL